MKTVLHVDVFLMFLWEEACFRSFYSTLISTLAFFIKAALMMMKQTPQEANKRTGAGGESDVVDIVKLLDLAIPEVRVMRAFSIKKPKYSSYLLSQF